MANVKKMAQKDAARWARAEMFFGEGAGVRRRLLDAEIAHKIETIPGYPHEFANAYESQDMTQHAIDAAKERRALDRKKNVNRNVRALRSGRTNNLTTGAGIALALWYVAKETGADQVIKDEAKFRYEKTKTWIQKKQKAFKESQATK